MFQGFFDYLRKIIGRHRIILSMAAGLIFIYFSTPTYRVLLIGSPVILLGEAIRTWASGYIRKDKELAEGGPYSLTRNPLYLGNFLIGLGFIIMANSLVMLAIFLIAFFIIYSMTIKNEEMSLYNKFGDSFKSYKKRVPVFFPVPSISKSQIPPLWKRGDSYGMFDWQLVKKHREHHTWLGIAGCLIIFIIKTLL